MADIFGIVHESRVDPCRSEQQGVGIGMRDLGS